jgi:hypothetical protein
LCLGSKGPATAASRYDLKPDIVMDLTNILGHVACGGWDGFPSHRECLRTKLTSCSIKVGPNARHEEGL